VLYRRFLDKLSNQAAQDILVLIFEWSLVLLIIMILLYLKGRATLLQIEPVPSYVTYIITSAYLVFKLTWYGYLLMRFHSEKNVTF